MADPTTPPTPLPVDQSVTDSWTDYGTAIGTVNKGMDGFAQMSEKAGGLLTSLSNVIQGAGVSLSNIGNIASQDSAKFGLLTTALIGATESFKGFAGIDTARVSTFSSQVKSLMDILSNPGTAAGQAKKVTQELADTLARTGRPVAEIEAAIKKGATAFMAYAENVMISADNALRLQNSFIQLTAAGGGMEDLFGGLDGVMQGVGNEFEHLNEVTDKYQKVMYDAMKATNTQDVETMYKYISQINKLPGGFAAVMSSMDLAGRKTSVLTAAIQYATGSGRDMADVTEDMSKAMAEYGATGDVALRFTARVTEASEGLHAQVKDVRDALMSSADAFKGFVFGAASADKMTQGMATSMENYIHQLTSVGVPVQNAINMFKNYTSQVQNMSQAQEAFLSAQSGGPGGLMGGFQIDAMMQKGDFQGLQRKVQDTIKKMTGPIVSLEQASSSQSAAAQYTRQIQILQQGPLGQMAKTRGEAEALLESMRKGTKFEPGKAPEQALEDTIKRGQNIEQLSLTKLGEIATNTQGLRMMAGTANLTTLQRAAAARTGVGGGVGGTGAGISPENQEQLRAFQRTGGGATAGSFSESLFRDLGTSIKGLPMAVSQSLSSFKEAISGGNQDKIREASAGMTKTMTDWRAAIEKMPEDQRKAQMDSANLVSMSVTRATQEAGGSGPRAAANRTDFTPLEDLPAGQQVGRAIPAARTATQPAAGAIGHQGTVANVAGGGRPIPVVLAAGSGITVNFTGKCPHCGWDQQHSEVAKTTNAPALLPR